MNDLQQLDVQASRKMSLIEVNENFKSLRAAATFGIDYATTEGLTFGVKGGLISNDGVVTDVADTTFIMSASTTNYIERTAAGVVSKNTTGFSADKIRLFVVTTNATGITGIVDHRNYLDPPSGVLSLSVAGGAGDTTLTPDQARALVIICTGVLTGNRGLVLPQLKRPWIIVNSTTGAFSLTAKTASGAGVVIPQGSNSCVFWDGTNTVALAAPETVATAQTLTDAANIAWNLALGGFATVTLGGNRTLDAPTNMKNGGSYVLIVKQDGTGTRTLAFAATYKFPGGTDPTMSTAGNAIDILTFLSDGTSMFGVAQKAFA